MLPALNRIGPRPRRAYAVPAMVVEDKSNARAIPEIFIFYVSLSSNWHQGIVTPPVVGWKSGVRRDHRGNQSAIFSWRFDPSSTPFPLISKYCDGAFKMLRHAIFLWRPFFRRSGAKFSAEAFSLRLPVVKWAIVRISSRRNRMPRRAILRESLKGDPRGKAFSMLDGCIPAPSPRSMLPGIPIRPFPALEGRV